MTDSREDLQAEIERTRDELGDTVAALAAKFDIKARARRFGEETRGRITGRPTAAAAVLVGTVMLVGLALWARRR